MLSISREAPLYREFLTLLLRFISRIPNELLVYVMLHCQSPRLGACHEAAEFWEEVGLNRAAGKKALYGCAVSGN